jgi:hypothetical protein
VKAARDFSRRPGHPSPQEKQVRTECEALYRNYGGMVKRRRWLRDRLDGETRITIEIAALPVTR